jgi:hypothetical protein
MSFSSQNHIGPPPLHHTDIKRGSRSNSQTREVANTAVIKSHAFITRTFAIKFLIAVHEKREKGWVSKPLLDINRQDIPSIIKAAQQYLLDQESENSKLYKISSMTIRNIKRPYVLETHIQYTLPKDKYENAKTDLDVITDTEDERVIALVKSRAYGCKSKAVLVEPLQPSMSSKKIYLSLVFMNCDLLSSPS